MVMKEDGELAEYCRDAPIAASASAHILPGAQNNTPVWLQLLIILLMS